MGRSLGFDFGNALPISSARIDPRRSRLYDTILRSPLRPPEHISGMGDLQIIPSPVTYGPSGGYTQPGGGVKITGGGLDVTIQPQPVSPLDQLRAWLDQSTIYPPYQNKWVELGILGVGYLFLRRK